MKFETGAKTYRAARESMRARGLDPMKYDYHRGPDGLFIAVTPDEPFETRLFDAIEGRYSKGVLQ